MHQSLPKVNGVTPPKMNTGLWASSQELPSLPWGNSDKYQHWSWPWWLQQFTDGLLQLDTSMTFFRLRPEPYESRIFTISFQNLLNNFSADYPYSAVARILILFQLITILPLITFFIRTQLSHFVFKKPYPGWALELIVHIRSLRNDCQNTNKINQWTEVLWDLISPGFLASQQNGKISFCCGRTARLFVTTVQLTCRFPETAKSLLWNFSIILFTRFRRFVSGFFRLGYVMLLSVLVVTCGALIAIFYPNIGSIIR